MRTLHGTACVCVVLVRWQDAYETLYNKTADLFAFLDIDSSGQLDKSDLTDLCRYVCGSKPLGVHNDSLTCVGRVRVEDELAHAHTRGHVPPFVFVRCWWYMYLHCGLNHGLLLHCSFAPETPFPCNTVFAT